MAEIKVQNIKGLWIALTRIYDVNDVLPSIFDYHMGRFLPQLQKEQQRLESIDSEKFQEIKDEKININVNKIKPSDLPEKMPNDIMFEIGNMKQKIRTMELLSPILIEDKKPNYESQIDQLLEKEVETNGKVEGE